jgi:hypothetical protein
MMFSKVSNIAVRAPSEPDVPAGSNDEDCESFDVPEEKITPINEI